MNLNIIQTAEDDIMNLKYESEIGLKDERRSSYEERKVDALALGAEEGRDKLRKATGSCK